MDIYGLRGKISVALDASATAFQAEICTIVTIEREETIHMYNFFSDNQVVLRVVRAFAFKSTLLAWECWLIPKVQAQKDRGEITKLLDLQRKARSLDLLDLNRSVV